MWNLPGPGIEPMSPALAGGFLCTAPPGRSWIFFFNNRVNFMLFKTLITEDIGFSNSLSLTQWHEITFEKNKESLVERASPCKWRKGEKVLHLSVNLIFLLLLLFLNTSGLHALFFELLQGKTRHYKLGKEVVTHFLHTLLTLTINPSCGLCLCSILSHYDWTVRSQITVISNVVSNWRSHIFVELTHFVILDHSYPLFNHITIS